MDSLGISAASGMRACMESLDMLANNIANTATAGYKSDRELYSLYAAPEAGTLADPNVAAAPVIEKNWTDFSSGALIPTGNPLDIALSGRGFFAVNGPNGETYTRNGSFRLSSSGVLTTQEGYPVRAVGGGSITIDASSPFEIGTDGTVTQKQQVLGRLEIVDFGTNGNLDKQGASYFRLADPTLPPGQAAGATVQQGALEGSNVGSAESAVRLVSVMRQFEMLQKAMNLGAQMDRQAVEEVAKVSS
jgi:flagellar basal-body rod protein FlgF